MLDAGTTGGGTGGGGTGGGASGGGSGGGGAGGGTGGGAGGGGGGPAVDGGDPFAEDAGSFDASVPYYDGGCGPIDAGNPPYPRRCAPATTNECGGAVDSYLTAQGVPAGRLNTTQGNGFDDDCDGLVDEGCTCFGNGLTKDCYLVPATQADQTTGKPVGWCANNSHGSVDCAGGELSTWSGVCRGAQLPSRFDVCSAGDFDCDGLSGNNQVAGCACGAAATVSCPTAPIQMTPYPPTNAIPMIDGSQWVASTRRADTTQWAWTVLGGDCDNVLPFPTFAIYASADGTATGTRLGTRTPVKFDSAQGKYVAASGEPLIAYQNANAGNGVAGGQVFTAFGLSGDYVVQGEFTLDGERFSCTQKVEVRAPGIRAELCWDAVGDNDIDLHFARLQGTTCTTQGWDTTCPKQDCYYNADVAGCNGAGSPDWGYADSANSACQGWSSRRGGFPCRNPRLDRDTVKCDRAQSDPTNTTLYCGPENINLDNPKDQDRFAVGVTHWENYKNSSRSHPHVNVYCNGRRVLSVGYNPATGQTKFPQLDHPGHDQTGDFWSVATIKANVTGGDLTSCDVAVVPSRHADTTRDGPVSRVGNGNSICVDSIDNASPAPNQYSYTSHKFVERTAQGAPIGSAPTAAEQLCKH